MSPLLPVRAARRARRPRRPRRGFTLAELLVAMTMLSIVMAAMVTTVVSTQRDYVRQRQRVDADEALRTTELLLTRALRTAGADPLSRGVGRLTPDPLAHGVFDNVRVRGDFNPADGDTDDPLEDVLVDVRGDTLRVRWQAGQAVAPVAYPVRSLRFEYFAVDGTALTTTAAVAGARRVRLTIGVPMAQAGGGTILRRSVVWAYLRN